MFSVLMIQPANYYRFMSLLALVSNIFHTVFVRNSLVKQMVARLLFLTILIIFLEISKAKFLLVETETTGGINSIRFYRAIKFSQTFEFLGFEKGNRKSGPVSDRCKETAFEDSRDDCDWSKSADRWSFLRGRCQSFLFSGCGGNENNFESFRDCYSLCSQEDACKQTPFKRDDGPHCDAITQRWSYSEGKCEQFAYNSCGANSNHFESEEICQETCVKPNDADPCKQPPFPRCNHPLCDVYRQAWTFADGKCVEFWWNEGGESNNAFYSEEKCIEECVEGAGSTTPDTQGSGSGKPDDY